jgi:hypothetical protein
MRMERVRSGRYRRHAAGGGNADLTGGAHSFEALEPRQLLAVQPGDDRFEPNDTAAEVRLAPENATNSPNLGTVTGQRIIRNLVRFDNDVFRIRLAGTGSASDFARVVYSRAGGGALVIQLLGPAGRVLQTGTNSGLTNTVSLQGRAPGIYFVRVFGQQGARNTMYRLTLQAPPPTPTGYEPNDTLAETAGQPEGANGSANLGAITGARSLSGIRLTDTYDIFRFRLVTPQAAGASQRFVSVSSAEPLNLVLFNEAGQSIRSASAYLGQTSIDLGGLADGAYFVQVTHYALTPGSYGYGLNWAT